MVHIATAVVSIASDKMEVLQTVGIVSLAMVAFITLLYGEILLLNKI